jgi:hypothetical protein
MIKDHFNEIDPILNDWLPKYGLTVYKVYKDDSVRSIYIIDDSGISYQIWIEKDDSGKSYQIWIEKNEKNNNYIVKAHWDLGKKINRKSVTKSWEKTSKVEQLFDTLDRAYKEVNNWIISNGSSRNWT